MDTTDPDIVFGPDGVCNHCRERDRRREEEGGKGPEDRRRALDRLVRDIKSAGREYDCLIGLSGGADSSAAACLVVDLGLRPLAVHVDNGWDSELAVANIARLVKGLRLDLITHVINWNEFRDLQRAFLRSSVVDLEMLSDNAIVTSLHRTARARNIPWLLMGTNRATESVMPRAWFFDQKCDGRNIRALYGRFGGTVKLKTYPVMGLWEFIRYRYSRAVRSVSILDYVDYDKAEAVAALERRFGWRDYGVKHGESKITRFYQGYILPTKFHIDKRKAFFSTLIGSGRMTRDEALRKLQEPLYDPRALRDDREFALKKLGFTEEEFEQIMRAPVRSHTDFPSYDAWHRRLARWARRWGWKGRKDP